jgi:SAM-dependent methyltransferase
MSAARARARELAETHLRAGDALGWFEPLYAAAAGDAGKVPWADLTPNANLVSWLSARPPEIGGRSALVVGCGLGDDAEHLAGLGYQVTAFDISATAIDWCRRRFPNSAVRYEVQDLFQPPDNWHRAFDLVFEAYTAIPAGPAAARGVRAAGRLGGPRGHVAPHHPRPRRGRTGRAIALAVDPRGGVRSGRHRPGGRAVRRLFGR